jgi:hypothetical protein
LSVLITKYLKQDIITAYMEMPLSESDNYIYLPRELRDCSVVFEIDHGSYIVSVSYNHMHNKARFIPFRVSKEQFEELLGYVEMNELFRAEFLNYIRTMLNQDLAVS